jgi:PPOX class probable F420-dependent enzyme
MTLGADVRDFLNERRFAVLATIGEAGVPQQTVMWFELQGDEIMMNTARGRVKDKHLRRDPRASICVEDGYRYVTLSGTVAMIEDQPTAQADIARLARRYEGAEQAERMITNFEQQERVTFRLRIDNVIASGFGQ